MDSTVWRVRTHSRSLTFVMVVAMASSTFALAVISALAAEIIDEFAITREQLGLLVTAAAFTGAGLAPILGPLADRFGARTATLFSLLSSATGLLAMSVAPGFGWLAGAALLAGIPQAVANPATNMLILAHVADGKRGVVTGIKQSGVQAGNALGGLLLPPIALVAGWRWGVVAAVSVPLLGAIVARRVVPRTAATAGPPKRRGDRAPTGIARLAIYGFLLGVGGTAVVTYLPLFGQEELGLSPVVAGATLAVMGVTGVVGRIGWGRMAEVWLGADRALAIVAALSCLVGLGLVVSPVLGAWIVWPVAILTGLSASSWNTLGMLSIIQQVPRESTGRASGTLMLGFLSGVGLGAPAFGRSVDAFGTYRPGWVAVTIVFSAALILMIPAGRRTPVVA
jgi:predicted MFS family arabinose efflux permease